MLSVVQPTGRELTKTILSSASFEHSEALPVALPFQPDNIHAIIFADSLPARKQFGAVEAR